MLIEQDLFGNVRDKVQTAIDIARMFEPKDEPYILADSGGKDSACVKRILDMAGVRYEAVYNVTTVDPAELVRHIISQYDGVIYDMPDGSHKYFLVMNGKLQKVEQAEMPAKVVRFTIPKYNMRQLIVQNRYPPTRLARYCCAELKEAMNPCRVTVTGARRAESVNRRQNSGEVVIFDGKQGSASAEEHNVNFIQTNRGGVVLNYDDAASRRVVEQCYRTAKTIVNPIADFTDADVWEFIHKYNVPYCKLYDEGFSRMGCIGCPMGNKRGREMQFARWPHMRKYYVSAFDEMLKVRESRGLTNKLNWQNGEDVMHWWISNASKANVDQIHIDDL